MSYKLSWTSILNEILKKELPQFFGLEHHALNSFYLAVDEGIQEKHDDRFLKGYNQLVRKTEETLWKLRSAKISDEEVDELVKEFINYDPLSSE